jgi:hypothetical protein
MPLQDEAAQALRVMGTALWTDGDAFKAFRGNSGG